MSICSTLPTPLSGGAPLREQPSKHGVPSPPYERDCDVVADVNFDMFARMSADFAADIGDYERA